MRGFVVSASMGISVALVALAWLLTRPFVASVIIGAKRQEQVIDDSGKDGSRESEIDFRMKLRCLISKEHIYSRWYNQGISDS